MGDEIDHHFASSERPCAISNFSFETFDEVAEELIPAEVDDKNFDNFNSSDVGEAIRMPLDEELGWRWQSNQYWPHFTNSEPLDSNRSKEVISYTSMVNRYGDMFIRINDIVTCKPAVQAHEPPVLARIVKLYQARIKHSNNDDERVGPMLAKINRFHHAEDKIIEGFSHKEHALLEELNTNGESIGISEDVNHIIKSGKEAVVNSYAEFIQDFGGPKYREIGLWFIAGEFDPSTNTAVLSPEMQEIVNPQQ